MNEEKDADQLMLGLSRTNNQLKLVYSVTMPSDGARGIYATSCIIHAPKSSMTDAFVIACMTRNPMNKPPDPEASSG